LGLFWFILAKVHFEIQSLPGCRQLDAQKFLPFNATVSKHVATAWNRSALVVVSSGLQNSISSSTEEGPTKRTKTNN